MPDGKSFFLRLGSQASLILLAIALGGPLGSSGSVGESSRPTPSCLDFVRNPSTPTPLLHAATATDAAPQVSALLFETEDEESDRVDAIHEPYVCFLSPGTFREVRDRQLIAPSSVLALYPLRC